MAVVKIPLVGPEEFFALVDEEDVPLIHGIRWYALRTKHTVYAVASQIRTRMHRLILQAEPGALVDHIDHNGLNNTRANLRFVTSRQNSQNRIIRSDNHCGFKGVYWHKQNLCWVAQIGYEGKKIQVGSFADVVEAAKAYDRAALELFGEFAQTNFES